MKGKKNLGILATLLACFAISSTTIFAADAPAAPAQRQAALDAYNKRPLSFEPNVGQTDARVKFVSRGPGYSVFLTTSEAVLSLQEAAADPQSELAIGASKAPQSSKVTSLRMSLVGANPSPELVGMKKLPAKSNYMIGNDRTQWHDDVPNYAKVKVQNVYPGVDLVYYGDQRHLEYDFLIANGADPSRIRLSFAGAKELQVDGHSGDLLITMQNGSKVRHVRPRVYQQAGIRRVEVAGAYRVVNGNQAAFTLAGYDKQHALVIDPKIVFSDYLGGNSGSVAKAIALDGSGNAYIAGYTLATNFPINNSSQSYCKGTYQSPCYDAFLTKLSASGAILFSSYWGGSSPDFATGVAVDSTGVYICGSTQSSDFPGVHQGAMGSGYYHVFVTKFSLTGLEIYSMVLGGSNTDYAYAIAVDSYQRAYIAGASVSSDFPMAGSWRTVNRGNWDAIVVKLNSVGSLVNSAYIGGSGSEFADGIAVDVNGQVFITGSTSSSNFPLTLSVTLIAGTNTFVSCINSSMTGFLYSTEFGGGQTYGKAIVVDAADNAFVAGYVGANTGFGTTAGAFQTTRPSPLGDAAFVTQLNFGGDRIYATYFGGSNGSTQANAIALHNGNIYVAGWTSSSNLPGTPLTSNPNNFGFVVKFTPQLNAINFTNLVGNTMNGVAVYQRYSNIIATYPQVYAAGWAYAGTVADANIVRLDETPLVICCAIQ
jgi:Beta-propeller repeat